MNCLSNSQPRSRRPWAWRAVLCLVLPVALGQTSFADSFDAARGRLRTDEPLFVAYNFQNPPVEAIYYDSSVAATTLQQPLSSPPPVPMLGAGLPRNGEPPLTFQPVVMQAPTGSQPAPLPAAEGTTGTQPQYGEQPEDFNIQFLRSSSVLLEPGQWQFDVGLLYAKDDYDFPITLTPSGVARADVHNRTLQVPFAVRYGWSERVQLSANMPVGWSHREFSSVGLFDETDNTGGIGDIDLGLNYHWLDGCYGYSPDVILSLGLTLPSGEGQFNTTGISQANLGNGVWATSAQLLFIQRYDPIVFFYGVGYRYQFEEDFDGLEIWYGHQFSYNLGIGFAVNDRVTLSTAFLGMYETETRIDNVGLPGSMREPLRLRFAATTYRCGRIVEPFAEIGMTDDAADAIVGIVWTL